VATVKRDWDFARAWLATQLIDRGGIPRAGRVRITPGNNRYEL